MGKAANWADKHLVPEWRKAYLMWSVWVDIAISVGGTAITILTLTSDAVQNVLGPWKFAAIFAAVSAVRLGLRLWNQHLTGKPMKDDDNG